jgi:hypothetical protein
MTTTSRMLFHHNAVEKRIAKQIQDQYGGEVDQSDLLISNVGKHWVNSRRLLKRLQKHGAPQAINYGWPISSKYAKGNPSTVPVTRPPGVNIWQTPGGAHPIYHQDYSQVVRLVSRQVKLCGPAAQPPMSGFGEMEPCDAGTSCQLPDGSAGVTQCVDIYELSQDERFWPLLSHNGPVYMRQESVPWEPSSTTSVWEGFDNPPPPNRLVPGPGPVVPPGPGPGPGPSPPPIPGVAGLGAGPVVVLGIAGLAAGWAAYDYFKSRRR